MLNTAGNFRATRSLRLPSARFPMPAGTVLLLAGSIAISGCGRSDATRPNESGNTPKQPGLESEISQSGSPDTTVKDNAEEIGREAEKPADIRGEVSEFHRSPDGDVDGMILNDGTLILFPPNAGKKVTELVAIGDQIDISGWTHAGESEVHAATIKNAGNGNIIDVDQAPPNILNGAARR